MTVPTLDAQRRTDVERFYDANLPNVCEASTSGVEEAFLVRMEYPEADFEGEDLQRDTAWARVLKSVWPQPGYHDPVTVVGEAWRVALVTHADPYQWRLKLERNVRVNLGV